MLVGDERRKRDALMLSSYLNMAMCHLKLDNNLDVVHNCEKALEMEPRNEKALYRRATVRSLYTVNLSHAETMGGAYDRGGASPIGLQGHAIW